MRGTPASWLNGKYAYPALAPLAALPILFVVLSADLFQRLENLTTDLRFESRAQYDPPADPRVLLVKIDQTSLDGFGRWPWDRSIHANLCKYLAEAHAPVAAFDLLFTEPSSQADSDTQLAAGMALMPCVSGAQLDPERTQPETDFGKTQPLTHVEGSIAPLESASGETLPIPPLRAVSYFGFVNVDPGAGGVRRDVPLVVRVGRQVFPELALQILCQYWGVGPDQVGVHLGRDIQLQTRQGMKVIPIDGGGKLLLNYRNKESYRADSYLDILTRLYHHFEDKEPMPANLQSLEDTIVLVGEWDPGLSDMGPSPIDRASPLVLVHATALANILHGDYLRVASTPWAVAGWLLIAWGTLFYLREKSIIISVIVPSICIAVYLLASESVFIAYSLLLPVVWPVAFFTGLHSGITLLRWLQEQKSRQEIRGIFASYIAPAVMERLLEHPGAIKLGGTRKPVTILFSDIRGFSSMSENMGEEELVLQLNEYFEKMVDAVNRYNGTLHKYIGDAVMAAWGDVIDEKPEIDAVRAVKSSLAMRHELVGLNEAWARENRRQLKIGIGLNHGMVLVGNIGATQRREFTLIGDSVNLASRLEGITKQFKTDLVIGESVQELVRGEFLVRTIGVIQVQGKTRPVRVYEVLDDLAERRNVWRIEWVKLYESGMEAYLTRDFTSAREIFQRCLEEQNRDYCSQRYLASCEEFVLQPPGADWTGTQVMQSK